MATTPIAAYRQQIPSQVLMIDDGDAGTAQTVALMYELLYAGSKDPNVNAQAVAIVNAANPRPFDFGAQRRAIFSWFPRNIRFVRDPVGVETLRAAGETLRAGAGDCDCQTILMGALLSTIGNHVRITTIESQPGNPDFSHVFLEVLDGDRWVPVDTARPGARYARGPEYFRRRFAWPNPYDPGADLGHMHGLNGYGLGQTAKELNASFRQTQFQRLGMLRGLNRLSGARRMGRLGRMGDDGIDWSGISQAVVAGTTGAANVVRAVNNQLPIPAYGYSTTGVPLTAASVAPAGYVNTAGMLISTETLLLGGGLLLFLVAMRK